MGRVAATFGGVLVLALIAGGLTEATLAFGPHGGLTNDILLRPLSTAKPTPKLTPSPAANPTAAPSPTSTPLATAIPAVSPSAATATTNSFVHMRSGKSTSTAIVADLNGGTVVEILPDSDAQWQQVKYAGQSGYIFKAYLAY